MKNRLNLKKSQIRSFFLAFEKKGITEEEIGSGAVFFKGTVSFFIIFTVIWTLVIQLLT